MSSSNLYKPIKVGTVELENRIVLAPLTRFRAESDHTPNSLLTEYYRQRAANKGSLLITEATFITERAGGYENVPGIWNEKQIKAWKEVTDAVHQQKSAIFMQLWALGRAASANILQSRGFDYVSASAVPQKGGNTMTGEKATPRALTTAEVKQYVRDYAQAAKNAIAAGMDGVEIHGAHGYLVNQFLDETLNQRTDEYGGSLENRARFLLEVVDAVIEAVGAERTAIRLSPWLNTTVSAYDISPITTYAYVITELQRRANNGKRLAYLHVVEPRVAGTISLKEYIGSNQWIRLIWDGIFMRAGGFTKELGEEYADLDDKTLIAYGRHYIPNPDLPTKFERNESLYRYDRSTFYTPGLKGYLEFNYSEYSKL
ncbi:NADPH dehydrogenase 2 [Trichomonascus vanleenenianus]|uniref:alkene reductase n=1 Tax=Trichomonascus vanleenenianus TaxID=2268995 RepID=UPI003ECB6679